MNNNKIRTITTYSILIALMLVMSFTHLGYIKIGVAEITLMSLPVIIGIGFAGVKGGLVLGTVFGLTSFIQCFGMSAFGAMLLSINPAGTFVVCFVTRLVMGWLTGLIAQGLKKVKALKGASVFIANLCCPLLNTLLFMTTLILFFYQTEFIQGLAKNMKVANPFAFVIAFVGVNGLVEAAACFVVGSAITKALQHSVNK